MKLLAQFLILVIFIVQLKASPSPPEQCGTLDLTSSLTQHCFPADGSHHFVCCVEIQDLDNPNSPHGNQNPLATPIKRASNATNYSWCTCSEEICTQQLGGRVQFNMNGRGWLGFAAPLHLGQNRPVYNQQSGPQEL